MDRSAAALLQRWVAEQAPSSWSSAAPEVHADRDEILVVVHLPEPADRAPSPEACEQEIERFRERSRDERVLVARLAEEQLGRPLSWGAACGPVRQMFTTLTVPAMTRLRLAERRVLDTLIAAGVARSRSEALAWCVRLVGANQEEWLRDLRQAFAHVERVRRSGPVPPEPP